MKIAFPFLLTGLLFLFACNQTDKKADKQNAPASAADTTHASFFPVTDYLKGQINNIPKIGITPLKYTIIEGHTDSVWLKENEYGQAFAEFLTPVIDSTNLTGYFKETNFTDLSYDSTFTFTYDPQKSLPDTFPLRSWIVYVDAVKSKVKRIYMVKKKGDRELKMTWVSDKWCSTATIKNNPDGTSTIEKEEKIVWSY